MQSQEISHSAYSASPEREIKSLHYIAGYVVHKLHKRFIFPFFITM